MSGFVKLVSLFPLAAAALPRRPEWPAPVGSALRGLTFGRRLRLMLRVGTMACVAAALAAGGLVAAVALLAARGPARDSASAAAPSWVEIVHPIVLYDLAGTDFAKLPLVYRARRHQPDDAREDRLTFGGFGNERAYLQLSLLRRGAADASEPERDLADDLARLAARDGQTATRIGRPSPIETRLGRTEFADLLVWQAGSSMPCLGFRAAPDGGDVLRVTGMACAPPGRPLQRTTLACAIDRIDLVSAGDDTALRAVFVAAARRSGSACSASTRPTAASPTDLLRTSGLLDMANRRASWLDADAAVPLRGETEGALRQR